MRHKNCNTEITQCLKGARGFSLIEVILALSLFAIAVPAVGHLFAVAFQQESDTSLQTQATFLANSLMSEISERRFRESALSPGNTPEAGELSGYDRRAFNDIDDYSIFSKDALGQVAWGNLSPPRDEAGVALTDYSQFSQYVEVSNLANVTSGPTPRADESAAADGTTDFKLVTVTVAWASGKKNVKLHKIFALN